jgi:hypothetical protein
VLGIPNNLKGIFLKNLKTGYCDCEHYSSKHVAGRFSLVDTEEGLCILCGNYTLDTPPKKNQHKGGKTTKNRNKYKIDKVEVTKIIGDYMEMGKTLPEISKLLKLPESYIYNLSRGDSSKYNYFDEIYC